MNAEEREMEPKIGLGADKFPTGDVKAYTKKIMRSRALRSLDFNESLQTAVHRKDNFIFNSSYKLWDNWEF